MLDALAQSWLTLQCRMLPNVRYALVALDTGGDGTLVPAAYWPESSRGTSGLVTAARLAMSKRSDVVRGTDATGPQLEGARLEMACPLLIEGRVLGVVAVELDAVGEQQQRAVMQLLRWGSPWLDLLIRQETTAVTSRLITLFQVVSSSVEHDRFDATATATVSALARHLDCERVSLGLGAPDSGVALQATSSSGEGGRGGRLARDLEACMNHALEEGRTLVFPPPTEDEPEPSSHRELVERHGPRAVVTVPLVHSGRSIGAFTLERRYERGFESSTVELCEALSGLLGPILDLKHEQSRPLLARGRRWLAGGLARVFGSAALGVKLTACVLVLAVAAAAFMPSPVRITGNATLEGRIQQALVAPLDGFVRAAPARAGQVVRKNDLLASLDTRDLHVERRRAVSALDELAKEHRQALAGLKGAEARVLAARMRQAEARIALLDEQLVRAEVRAPFDGVVVSGDLSQAIGAPVTRGQVLFELAPLDEYRVAVLVEDRDIAAINPGQEGVLTLASMPSQRLTFVVEQARAHATVDEGRNVFRIEGRFTGESPYLRPGMTGVAKITIADDSLLSAWTRDLVSPIRLWLWAALP